MTAQKSPIKAIFIAGVILLLFLCIGLRNSTKKNCATYVYDALARAGITNADLAQFVDEVTALAATKSPSGQVRTLDVAPDPRLAKYQDIKSVMSSLGDHYIWAFEVRENEWVVIIRFEASRFWEPDSALIIGAKMTPKSTIESWTRTFSAYPHIYTDRIVGYCALTRGVFP